MINQEEKTEQLETLDIKAIKFKEKTGMDFNSFYKSYYPELKFYLYKMCGDSFTSEEVATECIVKSLNQIDLYDPSKFEVGKKASFTTWLYKISRNHMIQILSKKKINVVSLDSQIDDDGYTLQDVISDKSYESDIDNDAQYELAKKKTELVLQNISNLSEQHKKVIIMREIDKLSYRDISYAMGTTKRCTLKTNDDYTVDVSDINPIKINYVTDKFDRNLPYSINTTNENVIQTVKIEDFYIGSVNISYTIPENENTIKSQIRCGRIRLEELTKDEFSKLNKKYL